MLSDRCLSCPVCPDCLSVTLVYCSQTVAWIKIKLGTEVGSGPGHIVLDGNPAPPKGYSPQFSAHVLWPNGWMDQNATWYGGRPRPRRHCARWGPPQRGGGVQQPPFRPMYYGQTMAGRIKMPLGTEVGLGPGHIVLDRDPALPKGNSPPPFSANVCCGQTAGWTKMPLGTEAGLGPGDIVLDGDPPKKGGGAQQPSFRPMYYGQTTAGRIKMSLGTEVGLGPGHIVLDGDPASPNKKGHSSPQFSAHVLRPNSWMDQDATWYGGRPRPRRYCARWGPQKGGGHSSPPFGPCTMAKQRLDGSRCHLVRRQASALATLC